MPVASKLTTNGDLAATPSSHVWVVSEPGFAEPVGTPVVLYRDCVVLGDRGLWAPGDAGLDRPIPIHLIHIDDHPEYLASRVALFKSLVPEEAAVVQEAPAKKPLRERLGMAPEPDDAGAPATKLESPQKAEEDTAGDDERTLWVDIDEHDEQWKPWRNVVRESWTRSWGSEWDLDGPPSCLEVAKHFDKNGGDPRLWLQLFEADKGIKRTDRLHHELATLIDTLYYAGSVDCLNVGGLLCLEVVARRLESIVEALRDGQEQANWDTAKYLAGRKSAMDCVSAGLRSWASSQVQNEARVQSYRTRAKGLGRGGGQADDPLDDGAPTDGGQASPGPGKGKRKPAGRGPPRGRGRGKM